MKIAYNTRIFRNHLSTHELRNRQRQFPSSFISYKTVGTSLQLFYNIDDMILTKSEFILDGKRSTVYVSISSFLKLQSSGLFVTY